MSEKKTKYFSGPQGVYYRPDQDRLMVLLREGSEIVSVKSKKLKFLGYNYYYWNDTEFRSKPFKGALIGMNGTIYLGEL